MRLLSWTEVDTALTCWARWDFAYGGRLAGDTLKERELAGILSDGRAWGAAVAAWHEYAGRPDQMSLGEPVWSATWYAHEALSASLAADAAQMEERGWPVDPFAQALAEERLGAMLDHYVTTTTPLPNLTRLEERIVALVPSRSSARGSTKYRFLCLLDGYTETPDGQRWLVEFKLRKTLTPVSLLQLGRQHRWYVWAMGTQMSPAPTGIYIDERLNLVPTQPRLVKAGAERLRPSHAKDQAVTSEDYVATCLEYGVEPERETVNALDDRIWQRRTPLLFSETEMEEAGRELTAAGKLIGDLDSGALHPIRHASPMTCRPCKYKNVCPSPQDASYVDSLFQRTVPKRLRPDDPQKGPNDSQVQGP